MISKDTRTVDHIKIFFDKNFIRSLAILSNRKIEPIIVNVENEEIIVGIKCPVTMDEETFYEDKKIIESDIINAYTDILNSEICNKKKNVADQKHYDNPCPKCGGTNTIDYGFKKTKIGLKVKMFCKDCRSYYINEN